MPRLNSSSSLSLAPEQRSSSPANFHCDTAGLHVTKAPLSLCGTEETIVTLGCPMGTRGHCDTSGPHGTKESIVALQGLMETRNFYDTGKANGTKWPIMT